MLIADTGKGESAGAGAGAGAGELGVWVNASEGTTGALRAALTVDAAAGTTGSEGTTTCALRGAAGGDESTDRADGDCAGYWVWTCNLAGADTAAVVGLDPEAEGDAEATGDEGTGENAGSGSTGMDATGTDNGVDGNGVVFAAAPRVEASCGDSGDCRAAPAPAAWGDLSAAMAPGVNGKLPVEDECNGNGG
jgi:hypothetical protein